MTLSRQFALFPTVFRISVLVLVACQTWAGYAAVTQPTHDTPWQQAMKVDRVYASDARVTGNGVFVTIIDDSMYTNHSWFKDNVLTDSCRTVKFEDMQITISDGAEPDDTSQGHGTNVTGCVYQVATGASLVGVKTDLHSLSIPTSINYANSLNSNVISNSYGMTQGYIGMNGASDSLLPLLGLTNPSWEQYNSIRSFNQAVNNDAVILYAAGNNRLHGNGTKYTSYSILDSQDSNKLALQAAPQTITVAALNNDGTEIANFSNFGSCIFVSAPGISIETSGYNFNGESYYPNPECIEQDGNTNEVIVANNGTSFSCPLVAGVVALGVEAAESVGNTMNSRLAKHIIATGSTKIADSSNDARSMWVTNSAGYEFSNSYGFGMINAESMVELAKTMTVTPQTKLTVFNGVDGLSYFTDECVAYYEVSSENDADGSIQLDIGNLENRKVVVGIPCYDSEVFTPQNTAVNTAGNTAMNTLGFTSATSPLLEGTVVVNGATTQVASGNLSYTESFTIGKTGFTEASFQSLEEVALTLGMKGCLGELEIILTHEGTKDGETYQTSSILAFAQETGNNLEFTDNSVLWTFTSNAFWGEDAEGTWKVDVYDRHDNSTTFNEDNILHSPFLSFYMGEMIPFVSPNDVPEPATWLMMILTTGGIFFIRKRQPTEPEMKGA